MSNIKIGEQYVHKGMKITIGTKNPFKGFEVLKDIFCFSETKCQKCEKSNVALFKFNGGVFCLNCECILDNKDTITEKFKDIYSKLMVNGYDNNRKYISNNVIEYTQNYYYDIKVALYRKLANILIEKKYPIQRACATLFRYDIIVILMFNVPSTFVKYNNIVVRKNALIVTFDTIDSELRKLSLHISLGKVYNREIDDNETLNVKYGSSLKNYSFERLNKCINDLFERIIVSVSLSKITNNVCKYKNQMIKCTEIIQIESNVNNELDWNKYYDDYDSQLMKNLELEYIGEDYIELVRDYMTDSNVVFLQQLSSWIKKYYGTIEMICSICNTKISSLYLSCCSECYINNNVEISTIRYDIENIVNKYEIDDVVGVLGTIDDMIKNNIGKESDNIVEHTYLIYQKKNQNICLKLASMYIKVKYGHVRVHGSYSHYFNKYNPENNRIKTHYSYYFICLMIDNDFGNKFDLEYFSAEIPLYDKRYDLGGKINNILFMIEIDDTSHDTDHGRENDIIKQSYCDNNGIKLFRINIRELNNCDDKYEFLLDRYKQFERKFSKFANM